MEKLYSDLEGLRIAMEIETRGREFYRQAYEQAKTKEHKQLFEALMVEEVEHLNTFCTMFNKVNARKEANSDHYLFDAETSRYLTVLAELHVFPQPEQAAAKIAALQTVKDILQTAIQAEKDSILFYDELARHAKFEDAKKVFEDLKQEEQKHVVKLCKILADYL